MKIILLHSVTCSAINLILLLVVCFTGKICIFHSILLYFHSASRLYFHIYFIKKWNRPIISVIISTITSVAYMMTMSFIFGAFSLNNWVIPSLLLGPLEISACMIDYPRYTYILGVLGFIFGSITFPLDWDVCWKEPPISHIILLIIGTFIGTVLDYFDYNQAFKHMKKCKKID